MRWINAIRLCPAIPSLQHALPYPIHLSYPKTLHLTKPSVHITIREQLSISLLRDGGLNSFELKGDLDLRVTDAAQSKIRLLLAPTSHADLQFKQHPNVAKFAPGGGDKIIALKDATRSFPVGQGLGVLRWRMTSKDESAVPLNGEWAQSLKGQAVGECRSGTWSNE